MCDSCVLHFCFNHRLNVLAVLCQLKALQLSGSPEQVAVAPWHDTQSQAKNTAVNEAHADRMHIVFSFTECSIMCCHLTSEGRNLVSDTSWCTCRLSNIMSVSPDN